MTNKVRRSLLAAGVLLPIAKASAQWLDATPYEGDVAAPQWPPPVRITLWPEQPPGAPNRLPVYRATMNGFRGHRQIWVTGIAAPDIAIFRAKKPDGRALLIIPGGGYGFLSVQNEGLEIAQRFNAAGITAAVLSYRLPGEGWANRHRVPLQDAQRAMRLMRAHAAQLQIDAKRIGVIGFSAGGHLAADLITAFDESCYTPVDGADALSARPEFAGLIYPVASFEDNVGHKGSRDALLDEGASQALIVKHSPARHVRADTPPCFIAHALDDSIVPVAASMAMLEGCRKAGVKVEAHLFAEGGHGFGLSLPTDLTASRWPDLFAAWMQSF